MTVCPCSTSVHRTPGQITVLHAFGGQRSPIWGMRKPTGKRKMGLVGLFSGRREEKRYGPRCIRTSRCARGPRDGQKNTGDYRRRHNLLRILLVVVDGLREHLGGGRRHSLLARCPGIADLLRWD